MIAIHHRPGSFSERWLTYCREHDIAFKLINCYENDIIEQVRECDVVLWHWHHTLTRDALFAKGLIKTFELMGKKVFPSTNTCWHYDDKVGQKYLFESVDAPFINTYVFYDKQAALEWVEQASFPKIFKLRGGAGSLNVTMCSSKERAIKKIKQAFSKGFNSRNRFYTLRNKLWHLKRDRTVKSLIELYKGIARIFILSESDKNASVEKNYVYFQDFVPNNDHDIRIIVIGKRAFAIKRMVRDGDFRASGSGKILYDPALIPLECVRMAFDVTKKIRSQCTAYDFVFLNGKPLIIEVSYGFSSNAYRECPGYWDNELTWISKKFQPEDFMLEDVLNKQLHESGVLS